jgi:type IV secretion system protein VirB9
MKAALEAAAAPRQAETRRSDARPPAATEFAAPATSGAASPVTTQPLAAGQTPPAAAQLSAPAQPAPTQADVDRLERRLARTRAQVRAHEVEERGTVAPTAAPVSRAKVVFPYYDNAIYEVYAAPDRMTAIELEPGERITTENEKPKAADTVQWIAETVTAGEGSHRIAIVMVKPVVTGIETNLLIPTNRRVYSVLLRSSSQAYMPLVGFSYPFDEAKQFAVAQPPAVETAKVEEGREEQLALTPEKLSFAYAIKGADVTWRPVRAFDDGAKTYLQMPPEMKSTEAPAFFVLGEDKTPQLVNYRVKGDYYIIDRLFAHGQLRVGTKQAVDIYRTRDGRHGIHAS